MIKLGMSTLGYSNTKTPMQKARTEETLNKLWKYPEGILSEKDFALNKLLNGYVLEKVENYQEYKRDGELTKPKTIYKLYDKNESYWNLISKTAYDFLIYVQENNLLDVNLINEYIQNEKAENERIEMERLQAEQEEKERKEQEKLIQEEERKRLWAENLKLWNDKVNSLLSEEQKEEIKKVITATFKQFNDQVPDTEIEKYINELNFITQLGNENLIKHQVEYIFFELDKDIKRYMNLAIEKAIYIHLFNIKETDTKRVAKNKVSDFYSKSMVVSA